MKDYRPNGCKMYVAIKDIEFQTYEMNEDPTIVKKGEVWMLKQITFGNRIWLNKQYDSEKILQITQEQLETDFVEVNINDLTMNTFYKFNNDECTEKVMLNGYEVSNSTFSWAFDDFCEFMGYPLD